MSLRYRLLGPTGCRVSELCLGAMVFGAHDLGWGNDDEREVGRIFAAFAEAGGNFVDTAEGYTGGQSERLVGEVIRADREYWVVATKYGAAHGDGATKGGNSRKHLVEAVEASLRRLGTDHVDLLQVHVWDGFTPVEEILRGLDDLVRLGKVVYVGLSNTPAWVCGYAAATAKLRGWSAPVSIQVPYSLLERSVERELLPMAEALDLSVLTYNPLARGILTGRHRRGAAGRRGLPELKGRTRELADLLVDVAAQVDATPAQTALAWLRGRSPNVIPILGASTVEQLTSNLACVELELPDEQRAALDRASAIELGHPAEQLQSDRIRTMLTGGAWPLLDTHRRPVGPSPF